MHWELSFRLFTSSSFWVRWRAACITALLSTPLLLGFVLTVLQQSGREIPRASHTGAIPTAEFSQLIQEFSERGGYFTSDNFVSNESSYLHIMKALKKHGSTGGAYLGVGPEQNFTYIAHVRPEIAFIVDIRRQAVIQHLMYKAIFHLAPDRARFLSILLSKPPDSIESLPSDAPVEKILERLSAAPSSQELYSSNLSRIDQVIREQFQVPLTISDRRDLTYILRAFFRSGLMISFRIGSEYYGSYWSPGYPSLAELILATDQEGKTGNFLANEKDYDFVRQLQLQNRIIPVVGDFGGTEALSSVAGYLRQNGYTLSAFYTSNVEQYLFQGDSFDNFVANVRQLPIDEKSLILRSIRTRGSVHPERMPGHRMFPLMVFVSVFLKDYEAGLYSDYWHVISTHYISSRVP